MPISAYVNMRQQVVSQILLRELNTPFSAVLVLTTTTRDKIKSFSRCSNFSAVLN